MTKWILLSLVFLMATIECARAEAPVVFSGSKAKWLPSALKAAGVCVNDVTGLMSIVAPGSSGNILTSNGTTWVSSTPASSGWALTGNSGTTAGTNFIGTTDGQDFVIKRNSSEVARATSTGLRAATLEGSGSSAGTLALSSTSNATKGKITFGNSTYDEANNRLGIGTTSPQYRMHLEASADDYSHGFALSHALGGPNSLWRIYPDLNGTIGLANPNQTTVAWSFIPNGSGTLAGGAYADGATISIANQVSQTTKNNLALSLITSQTGDFLQMLAADHTTLLAKVGPTGAGTFAGMTVSTLGSGLAKLTSGAMSVATSGTDYAPATSGTAILKGNGAGGFSSAVSATDYAPATTGSSILKASSGGFSNAVSGTDYAPATSGTAIQKGNGSGGFSSAVSATDYAPATTGSSILKASSGGFANAVSGTDYAPATSGTAILKGNGSGGFSAAAAGTDYQAIISTSSAVSNQFVTGFTAPNTFTRAQPAFTDISGTATAAQLPAPATSAISASNIDWSTLKNIDGLYTKTLSANTTLTWSNVTAGQTIVIALTNTASNYTVTWPAVAKWSGTTAPVQTTGAKTDVYTCKAYDSTNAYCSAVQNY